MQTFVAALLATSLLAGIVRARPQGTQEAERPMPYEYNYKVEDATNSVYFGKNEAGNEVGRVDGSYYVWLPDGRLMTVTYYVDGESGFVPKISFEENANPLGAAAKPAGR